MNTYDKGDLVRCAGVFTDSAGAAVDPDVVKFSFKTPDGTVTTYTYLTDAELARDSAGHYHVDVDAAADGTWWFRFLSTG